MPDTEDENIPVIHKKTLGDLGYHFNDQGKLRKIDTDEGFVFTNQKEYEAIGDAMTEELFKIMTDKLNLVKIFLKTEKTKKCYGFIFATEDYATNDTVLVLIHGSGAVKAGQWARKLILNESLEVGSQFPYIERAIKNGWAVVVLNFNQKCEEKDEYTHVNESSLHALVAWKKCVSSDARNVMVVAHSYGGSIISEIMNKYSPRNVRAICLTDSWYGGPFSDFTVNFHTRKSSLKKGSSCWEMFSGTNEHERSSAAAFHSVFYVLENVSDKQPVRNILEQLNQAKPEESDDDEEEQIEQ